MANISILLPTRERPTEVYRLFESLLQTTSSPKNIEIVLYMDSDDTTSHDIDYPALPVIKIIKPPGNSMGKIFNECYAASNGRYIMLMNDDVVFNTKNWDVSVMDAFSQFQDDVAFIYGNDLDQGERVPSFPILPRKVCDLMGGVCPSGYLNLHIESHLFDIFKQLKHLGHKRIVYMNDVIFEHLHFVLGKSERDKTSVKKNTRLDDRLFLELAKERSYLAKKLSQYIKEQKEGQVQLAANDINIEGKSDNGLTPIVSVVVPIINYSSEYSIRCINTIINESNKEAPFEVIVVSCDPIDASPLYLLNKRRKIKVIQNRESLNFAKLCNQGTQEARGDFLIFFRDDCLPAPGWINALVKTVKANKDIAVVSGKIINNRNQRIHNAGISFLKDGGKFIITHIYKGVKADNPAVNGLREFQAISTACMLVKKSLFLKAGGFDETLNSLEDIDLCLKIRELGMKVFYTPEAIIYHHGNTAPVEEKAYEPDSSILVSKWGDKVESDLDKLLMEDGFSLHKSDNIYSIVKNDKSLS